MKMLIVAFVLLITGCVTTVHPPFVDTKSNLAYATVKGDESRAGLKLWIGMVDGMAARKSIFGEDLLAGSETYVTPGFHKIGAYCNFLERNRYAWVDLGFELEKGKTYSITCAPNETGAAAKYNVTDENGNEVKFEVTEREQ